MRASILAGALGSVLLASILGSAFLTVPAPVALAQQAPPKTFSNAEALTEARRLEARVRAESDVAGRTVQQILREADTAAQRNDHRAAANLVATATVVEPNNPVLWLRLAETYRRVSVQNDWRLQQEMQWRSTGAAYLAYLRGRNPQEDARALAVLAETLTARFTHRPALDALRTSLQLAEAPAVRRRYDELLDQHGFRFLDNRVDSDTTAPRACFEFSEPLRPRLDPTPFVRMPGGIPGNVTASGQQLCIDGLKHGERYEVVIRAGLPSAVGETLRRDTDHVIYVRDHTPTVRFTGRNYVLPRNGQQGIPVVTINLAEVGLRIFRIGDRGIARAVTDEDFLGALRGEGAERLVSSDGVRVWDGVLTTENRLNEEVVTAFPVTDAVGRLEPGIYVMLARRLDQPEEERFEPRVTQWFVVSDLGISSMRAGDGLHVELRSIGSAQPIADADVRLIARSNEVLATARTDARGLARFEAALMRGEGGLAPGLVVAQREGDYALLSLSGSPFDLTDRGVAGRAAPGALDAFVVTERGVYRSGETVHVTTLLRDAAGNAIPDVPLTLVLERPDGVEVRRDLVQDAGAGGRSWSVPLLAGSSTGSWRIKVLADPRRPPIGQTTFLVEDYVPDRLDLTLTPDGPTIARARPAQIDVAGRWLFGAPAADLQLEGETIVSPLEGSLPGLEGYRVGLADVEVPTVRRPLSDLPRTDRDGRARVAVALPEMPATSRPMRVEVLLRMTEGSGRGIERKVELRVADPRPFVGIRPLFGSTIGEGETATFDVAMLGANGQLATARGLTWELSRIDTRFVWYRTDGRWNFERVTNARRVGNGTVDVAPGQPGRVATRVEWGRYRLDVSGPDGAQSSVVFSAGWAGADLRVDTPDILDVALDKERYTAGETARLRVNARFAGTATIRVVGEAMHATQNVTLAQGPNTIDVPVGSDWGAGAYVVATAFRPLDEGARRQPGRAIGVRWLALDQSARTIPVTLDVPAQIEPRRQLTIPVRLAGLAGESARVTVAAVDLGILNLTGHRPPDPVGHVFGQRALSAEMRDLYGFLIDGMQGTRGRIRSGGDGPAIDASIPPPSEAPLALFSGVVQVGADGTANVTFDIPAFAGTLRVMTIAWTATKVGAAHRDVIVRDPVVVAGTLPRFLAAGDRSRFLVDVTNVDGPAGEYTVSLDVTGPVVVPAEALRQTMQLQRGERRSIAVPITAAGMGRAGFDIAVAGPGGVASARSYVLGLQPANPITVRRTVRTIAANGGALTVGADLLADVIPGTGSVSISIGSGTAADVPGLIKALDRYPLACTEQTIARAYPLLYLSGLAEERQLALSAPVEETVRDAIQRVLARQASNGSFGLWRVGGDDPWLDAFVADFLTRARERGFTVPRVGFDLALDRLRNQVMNPSGGEDEVSPGKAYALYVLARNGRPVIGDLRYLADTRGDEMASPLAQAQVAGGLALLGDRTRANALFTRAVEAIADAEDEGGRPDYGSRLRDNAALLAMMAEANADRRLVTQALQSLERARSARRFTSTQENMWMVLAARAARADAERITLEVGGQPHAGPLARSWRQADLARGDTTIRNTTAQPVQAVVSIQGATATPEPAASQGFELTRVYRRMDGTPADPRRVRQNERMVVVLTLTEAEPRFGRVVIEDRLPAGFEIDSPNLVDSARVRGVPVAEGDGEGTRPVHTEFRDDRFVAAFDRQDDSPQVATVAYIVRAVAPGTYAHPGAFVEDMYRPERFARTAPGTVEVVTGP